MIIEQTNRSVRMEGLGDSISFGIRSQDMAFVTGILTDKLYSNKILAVIREYICNAIDANNDNNSKKNVLITPPSQFEPVFKVRDFGIGLSYDDVKNIYVYLGLSTKRNSNEMIGAFGIGCKAGFAYTDSFNITSWHNGLCNTYTAQKNKSGGLDLFPIGSYASNEPSGIEISIAINSDDISAFNQELKTFCKYLSPVPVFSDSSFVVEPIKKIIETENFFIEDSNRYGSNVKVIMGNVIYPVDTYQLSEKFRSMYNVIIKCDLGEVSISPDREKLEYTKETKEALESKANLILQEVKHGLQEKIDNCEYIHEASDLLKNIRASFSLSHNFSITDFTFKGKEIPKISSKIKGYWYKQKGWRTNSTGKFHSLESHYNASSIEEHTIIIKAPSDSKIMPSRFVPGFESKVGFKPKTIIVSDEESVFENLMVDYWNPKNIVSDYKSFWVKPERSKNYATLTDVNIYRNNVYSHGMNTDYVKSLTVIPYVLVEGKSKDFVNQEDKVYIQAANDLNLEYYTVNKRKFKSIQDDCRFVNLSDVIKNGIEQRIKKINHKSIFIKSRMDEVKNEFPIDSISMFIKNHKDTIATKNNNFLTSYNYIENFIKDSNDYKNELVISYALKLGVKIPNKDVDDVKKSIDVVIENAKKYSLAIKLYDKCSWRMDEVIKEINEYIEMVNLLDKKVNV